MTPRPMSPLLRAAAAAVITATTATKRMATAMIATEDAITTAINQARKVC